jgi:hypothetical protein
MKHNEFTTRTELKSLTKSIKCAETECGRLRMLKVCLGDSFMRLAVPFIASSRDENGFGIFRYSGNRFRIFSIGFIGNGIFRKRNRFSEFSIGIGIGIGVVFYRLFSSVTRFSQKLPDLCLGIFQNCVSDFFRNFPELCLIIFFGIFQHVIFSHRLYVSG